MFPDGKVIGCIGPVIDLPRIHPIYLGNLRQNTFREVLDQAQTNVILHALRAWGPNKLIKLMRENGLADEVPSQYIKENVCDACYKLMSNERIVAFLLQQSQDSEFRRRVAYARAYYLNEPEMVRLLAAY